jgi:hypothetical protein
MKSKYLSLALMGAALMSSMDSSDGLQFIELSTEDAGAGVYYVLKTDRWAVDNLSDLVKVIDDFKKRIKDHCN